MNDAGKRCVVSCSEYREKIDVLRLFLTYLIYKFTLRRYNDKIYNSVLIVKTLWHLYQDLSQFEETYVGYEISLKRTCI